MTTGKIFQQDGITTRFGRAWLLVTPLFSMHMEMAGRMLFKKTDEVARNRALSNGSNGQRSFESAPLHFGCIFESAYIRSKDFCCGLIAMLQIRSMLFYQRSRTMSESAGGQSRKTVSQVMGDEQ
jgi:hypothetical protein